MKRKTIRRTGIVFLSILVALTAAGLYFYLNRDLPPIEEMKQAREQISKAKNRKAKAYSVQKMKRAEELYDSAMLLWTKENERFFLFRQYDSVRMFARESANLSGKASTEAEAHSKYQKKQLGKEIDALQNKVRSFQNQFSTLPIDDLKKKSNSGKLLLGEARIAWENGNYSEAREKVDQAKIRIESSYEKASQILSDYFSKSDQWKKWASQTLALSRKNQSYAILVDKFDRKCYLYYNGTIKHTYEVELGKNWMGQKNHQGDQSTPEGLYKVSTKKENGRTKYHKALLINYPNDEDKSRFNANKKNGAAGSNKGIGGLIEIHGNGGQGADWTDGCIALQNKDMDQLFAKTSVGTPVTIVGSLKNLDEIRKERK